MGDLLSHELNNILFSVKSDQNDHQGGAVQEDVSPLDNSVLRETFSTGSTWIKSPVGVFLSVLHSAGAASLSLTLFRAPMDTISAADIVSENRGGT